jgi:multicomponent Na+:H+ antiporter subunit F
MKIFLYSITFSIFIATISLCVKKDIWNKLIGVTSLMTKMSMFIFLYAYLSNQTFLADVALFYLIASGVGSIIISLFLSGSDSK